LNIGLKIKEVREKIGLNQEEFASLINKSTSSIKKYEANNNITVDLLQNIAEKLDVSMLSLFSDSSDLFKLFLDVYNFNDLSPNEREILKIEFNVLIEFLLNKHSH